MKIVIATGIYPPAIGGTATYARELYAQLQEKGHEVEVITYSQVVSGQWSVVSENVIGVSKAGGPLTRWKRYADALQKHAADADVVIVLSSVSVGMPLRMAKLQKPKKILRLGGDFFWERYTDKGGMKSLHEWYRADFGFWKFINSLFMGKILRSFDQLVYSTEMQRDLHQKHYSSLPLSTVLENAVPANMPTRHSLHEPMKLLCMSRFVGFKNLSALLEGVSKIDNVSLTMVGDGPEKSSLQKKAKSLKLHAEWREPTPEKKEVFDSHDLLIIPSTTEISPNTALEARSYGLPVLLSAENGLSGHLLSGMVVAPLFSADQIAHTIEKVRAEYDQVAEQAAAPASDRAWSAVADDWITLLSS